MDASGNYTAQRMSNLAKTAPGRVSFQPELRNRVGSALAFGVRANFACLRNPTGWHLGCLGGWLLLALLCIPAGAADSPLSGSRMADVTMPFYLGAEQEPSAVLRAEKVFRDYQRRGFFRIGLLPMAVLEGVVIEVRHPAQIGASLGQLQQWLRRDATGCLELRRVRIVLDQTPARSLEAGCARPLPDGAWQLLGGVRWEAGTNLLQAASATLQVTGERAGRLILATAPPQTNDFLLSSPISNP